MKFDAFVLFLYSFLSIGYSQNRPQIHDEHRLVKEDDQFQKQSSETLQLTCVADYPVKWILTNNTHIRDYTNPHQDGRFKTVNTHGKNNITIVLNDLKWTDTGFYRCVSAEYNVKSPSKILEENENRVYIFVKDNNTNHLFLHLNDDIISFKRHEESYVKCLVTDMTAKVELYYNYKKITELEYDNRFGFQRKPGDMKYVTDGTILCKAKVPEQGKADELEMLIWAIDTRVKNYNVTLTSNDPEYQFFINNNVTLTCNSNSQIKKCSLTNPQGKVVEREGKVDLTINLTDSDSGVYNCSCNDVVYPENQGSMERTYIVRKTKANITYIKGNVGKYEEGYENGKKRFDATFRLLMPEGYSSSDVSIHWYHKYSKVMSDEILVNEIRGNGKTIKRIKTAVEKNASFTFESNPEINASLILDPLFVNSSGEYILEIIALDVEVNYTFNLKVRSYPKKVDLRVTHKPNVEVGSPNVVVDSNYLQKGSIYNIWCVAEGIPTVEPSLLSRSCIGSFSANCGEWSIINDSSLDDNVKVANYKNGTYENAVVVQTVATVTKSYKCVLESMPNVPSSTISYIVTDIRDAQENKGFAVERKVTPDVAEIVEHVEVKLVCKVQKYIYADPEWYFKPQNGSSYPHEKTKYTIEKDEYSTKAILILKDIQMDEAGNYTCKSSRIENGVAVEIEEEIKIHSLPIRSPIIIIALKIAAGALGILVLGLLFTVIGQRLKYRRKLKKLGEIQHKLLFEPNNNEIVADLPLHEQPENLKYNIEMEMPKHFLLPLTLPKVVLGWGITGEVVKAILKIPNENLPVAVKTLKKSLPVDQINLLLSEVKIMMHIGVHVNVLPLIGAISSLLQFNEYYVVTEYCSLGSLLSFLKQRRRSFVNELRTINSHHSLEKTSNFVNPLSGYVVPTFQSPKSYHRYHLWPQGSCPTNELCTSDLLFIAYQIANGMEFLSSKNVIHRDLAARNILINGDNIIRISDFGLSRLGQTYQLVKNRDKLPFMWLALEAWIDRDFSEKSDIWSFGILLWELFSLGEAPYQNYQNSDDLLNDLRNGMRLHKPEFASEQIYILMKRCWLCRPENRPSYAECKSTIAIELKRFCSECHSRLETVLKDPKNQPDYSHLHAQFADDGYEVPKSHQNIRNTRNYYYPFPTKNGSGKCLMQSKNV